MCAAADIFGELVVESILGTGLNAFTATTAADRILKLLRKDADPLELLRVFANPGKIRGSFLAWRNRENLYRSYVEAEDKIENLDAIHGIGKISAERLMRKLAERLPSPL